ncbi:nuclear mRNA splicing factor-associated protein [Penicillium macrosclerotiorum]|uniref:nuclear mRNA splicing factor-associated protein n=1 Tax=Penicillium macrosclerotiorum TaxID=303699 RepID=UPI0025488373|nr:nuclear mRNA splicing factor-associated protein [Penicillium macrosclerotiorum]KAJ5682258.1 nuclear mRNA splicing factor-associated protein [Penicillium macrosclerotiorum]
MSSSGTPTSGAEQSRPFPTDPSTFESDPRISFSKLDDKYILETTDGQEFQYDNVLKRWVQAAVDEELIRQQQEAYKVEGVDEEEAIHPRDRKKRKNQAGDEKDGQKPKKQRVNTAVFVTSLPLDVDAEEVRDVFSKCGVIAEEIDSGRPRIKMYNNENGDFKGEALVVYFRPESVNLAIQMLDETEFRLGQPGPLGPMRVQAADFSFKSEKDAPPKTSMRDKKKIIQRTQKLNSKLADWDDDDPSTLPETNTRFEKIVILKHMFTLKELEDDPAAILDIKEDIREECSKIGEVTNVVLYDQEIDGVVSVRFADPSAARQCVKVMDGRYFGGTRVEAYVSQEREKFKKTNARRAALEDMAERGLDASDEEEERRLDEFGSWLERSEAGKDGAQ